MGWHFWLQTVYFGENKFSKTEIDLKTEEICYHLRSVYAMLVQTHFDNEIVRHVSQTSPYYTVLSGLRVIIDSQVCF